MMNAEDGHDVFATLQHTRVIALPVPGAFDIRGPRFPWHQSRHEAEKRSVLELLEQRYARRVIWLNAWNEDVACDPDVIGAGSDADMGGWFDMPAHGLTRLYPKLYQGGWGLFMFSGDVPTLPKLEALPWEASELCQLIRQLGARLGLIAWYDDVEWRICFSNPVSLPES